MLCEHIHYFHDYKFPLFDSGNPTYGIELSKRQIDLTGGKGLVLKDFAIFNIFTLDPRKVVLPGELIRPLFKKPTSYNSGKLKISKAEGEGGNIVYRAHGLLPMSIS